MLEILSIILVSVFLSCLGFLVFWLNIEAKEAKDREEAYSEEDREFFKAKWWKQSNEENKVKIECSGKSLYLRMLGIPENSSIDIIKKAYRKLMLINHPDKGGNIEKCKNINSAYEYLMRNI